MKYNKKCYNKLGLFSIICYVSCFIWSESWLFSIFFISQRIKLLFLIFKIISLKLWAWRRIYLNLGVFIKMHLMNFILVFYGIGTFISNKLTFIFRWNYCILDLGYWNVNIRRTRVKNLIFLLWIFSLLNEEIILNKRR